MHLPIYVCVSVRVYVSVSVYMCIQHRPSWPRDRIPAAIVVTQCTHAQGECADFVVAKSQ